MKTAMQQAIEHYQELSIKGSNEAYVIYKFLENHLPIEQKQIIDAYQNGALDSFRVHRSAEEYYAETFKNKENERHAR